MSERTRFIGLDAHAATIAVAVADPDGSVTEHGTILNNPVAVRKLVSGLAAADTQLKVAYEAGPPAMRCTGSSPDWGSSAWWWRPR
jgi:hypothetical protein